MRNKKEKIKKLIIFDEDLNKKITDYQVKHYYSSFTKTVRELIKIGLGDKKHKD